MHVRLAPMVLVLLASCGVDADPVSAHNAPAASGRHRPRRRARRRPPPSRPIPTTPPPQREGRSRCRGRRSSIRAGRCSTPPGTTSRDLESGRTWMKARSTSRRRIWPLRRRTRGRSIPFASSRALPRAADIRTYNDTGNTDLEAIVDAFASRQIVVMVTNHSWGRSRGTGANYCPPPDADQMQWAKTYWRDIARKYGKNPYVWFNFWNEPVEYWRPMKDWEDIHTSLIDIVRQEGAENMVVVDDKGCGGQNKAWETVENSGAYVSGQKLLNHDPLRRVIFSVHGYDASFSQPAAQPDELKARVNKVVSAIHGKGLALVFGEFGGASRQALSQALFDTLPARGVGMLAWVGTGDLYENQYGLVRAPNGTVSYPINAIDDPKAPKNLSWMGERIWNLAHAQ